MTRLETGEIIPDTTGIAIAIHNQVICTNNNYKKHILNHEISVLLR